MILFVSAFLLGLAAGLRSFLPLAAASWAARLETLRLDGGAVAFLGSAIVAYGFTALELVADKLPQIPSRKTPGPFVFRIVSGAVAGGAVGFSGGAPVGGAVAGTLAGHEGRARLAAALGKDRPAALLEDAAAILMVLLAVSIA